MSNNNQITDMTWDEYGNYIQGILKPSINGGDNMNNNPGNTITRSKHDGCSETISRCISMTLNHTGRERN
jgi:hypothetical protein